jgi:hypothetical protein
MLDRLSHQQDSRCEVASQVFDAPETPAPLFAYRALKSVLFGTHDGYESDENNKENICLDNLSDRLTESQNTPRKSQASTIQTPPRQRPTPRRLLSPAKSILRTPGVPTPRRQNVTVKFKDAKSSSMKLDTSMDGVISGHAPTPQPVKQSTVGSVVRPGASRGPEVLQPTVRPQSGSTGQAEAFYNVEEMDAYMASTEHEMKKLVRYGQRMREFARLTQKENALLKRELDGLRKDMKNPGRGKERQIGRAGQRQKADRENGGLFDLTPIPSPPKLASPTASKATQPEFPTTTAGLSGTAGTSSKSHHQVRPRRPSAEREGITRTQLQEVAAAAAVTKSDLAAPFTAPATSPRPTAFDAYDTRMAARTQLPPDRVAAAKARLRLKSEQRKRTPVGMVKRKVRMRA